MLTIHLLKISQVKHSDFFFQMNELKTFSIYDDRKNPPKGLREKEGGETSMTVNTGEFKTPVNHHPRVICRLSSLLVNF